jgi:protein gp37
MGERTAISWTDDTFNPWWGCHKVSPGCDHCYAETWSKRVGQRIWGPPRTTTRRLFGPAHWEEPLRWHRAATATGVRRRVFCASMADVFEVHPQLLPEREKLWRLIEATPMLIWLLLTKRPEQIARMLPDDWLEAPRQNVWLGASAETQHWADLRIPRLLDVPAALHFVSAEPLLGPVDLRRWLGRPRGLGIDWVIAGGESGPGFRPMDPAWARSLRDQCRDHGTPFHFKQVGGLTHAAGGRALDGREWLDVPFQI